MAMLCCALLCGACASGSGPVALQRFARCCLKVKVVVPVRHRRLHSLTFLARLAHSDRLLLESRVQ